MINKDWTIESYLDDKFTPASVKRTVDNVVFSIGDFVTNGTKMKGHIESFDLFNLEDLFVLTNWSGVGMHISELEHIKDLPSKVQVKESVKVLFKKEHTPMDGIIIGIHFLENKTKFDIELKLDDNKTTRIYNVDSTFVRSVSDF